MMTSVFPVAVEQRGGVLASRNGTLCPSHVAGRVHLPTVLFAVTVIDASPDELVRVQATVEVGVVEGHGEAGVVIVPDAPLPGAVQVMVALGSGVSVVPSLHSASTSSGAPNAVSTVAACGLPDTMESTGVSGFPVDDSGQSPGGGFTISLAKRVTGFGFTGFALSYG
jgi:hypothetical protein